MQPTLKPHLHNKPSGIPWVDTIPSHWAVRTLRSILRPVNERNHADIPLLSVVREQGVILRDLDNTDDNHNVIPEDLSNYKLVRPKQFAINKMKAWQGSYGVSLHEGIVSPAYFVFDVLDIDPEFLHRATRSKAYVPLFDRASDGVRIGQWDLSHEHLRDIPIAIPPLDEQAAIVRYLDHADELINRYISAKERLIALLEEQRQAIINQAVTLGIDPKVNLKPSGAHWLGDVPEHWKMCRSKRLFSPRREFARPHDIQLSATQAFGVIAQDDYEQRVGRKVVKVSLHLDKRLHVEVDDFVISMRSFQGGLERAWSTGCIRSSYVILRPTSDVDVGFFTYLFKSQAYIQAIQSTGDFIRDGQDLNFNNFCAVDLPLPPAQEQGQIAAALQIATDNIDTNISGMRRQIHLMHEYRTRLITDVVTGQLDVRDATVELPD